VLDEAADEVGPSQGDQLANPTTHLVALKPVDKALHTVKHTFADDKAEGGPDDKLCHAHG
jgi:hypothetical protein